MTCVAASVYNMAAKPSTKPKPEYGQRLELRRGQLRKSLDNIADETNGFLYKQLLYRLENGKKRPQTLSEPQIVELAHALEWSPAQLAEALDVVLPSHLVNPDRLLRPTPATRLLSLREQRGLERRQLAEKSGLPLSQITKLEEHSDTWAKSSEMTLKKLSAAYDMPHMEFLELINGTPYPAKANIFNDTATFERIISRDNLIPVYDLLQAGPGGRGGEIVDYVDRADGDGEQVGYVVSGHSMSPEINPGDKVVIKVQNYASARNIIVCWTPEDGTIVKYLKEIRDDGFYVLTSINPEYPPIWTKEITIFGIMIQLRKNYQIVNGNH